MKTISPTLQTHLNGTNAYLLADLYTVVLGGRDGETVLRWTSADTDITYGGNTYSSVGPAIERSKTRLSIDLEVDTLDITLWLASGSYQLDGVPLQKAALDGRLDGAFVTLERVWLTSWASAPVGGIVLFRGLASVKVNSTSVELTVKSEVSLLSVRVPRNPIQPSCPYQIYGPGCDVNRATYTASGTVTSGTTASMLNHSPALSGYVNAGAVVTFTSGLNVGLKRVVRDSEYPYEGASGVLNVTVPFPNVPAVGDTFTVSRGCNKTASECENAFNNLHRFRGFTDVPTERDLGA